MAKSQARRLREKHIRFVKEFPALYARTYRNIMFRANAIKLEGKV